MDQKRKVVQYSPSLIFADPLVLCFAHCAAVFLPLRLIRQPRGRRVPHPNQRHFPCRPIRRDPRDHVHLRFGRASPGADPCCFRSFCDEGVYLDEGARKSFRKLRLTFLGITSVRRSGRCGLHHHIGDIYWSSFSNIAAADEALDQGASAGGVLSFVGVSYKTNQQRLILLTTL